MQITSTFQPGRSASEHDDEVEWQKASSQQPLSYPPATRHAVSRSNQLQGEYKENLDLLHVKPPVDRSNRHQREGSLKMRKRVQSQSAGSSRSRTLSPRSPASSRSGKSNISKRSGLTRNPLHFEDQVMQHAGPGLDDRESHIYRDFDSKGRIAESFYQRAALQGIKNLETTAYNRDSSINKIKSRFPEKYANAGHQGGAGAVNPPTYSSRQVSAVKGTLGIQNQGGLDSASNKKGEASFFDRLSQGEVNEGKEPEPQPKMSKSEEQLILEASFSAVSDNILANQMQGTTRAWLSLRLDEKLLQYTSFLSHMRKDYRLGAIVGLYVLISNGRHTGAAVGHEITRVILEEVFASLADFRNQDPLLIKCELEVLSLLCELQSIKTPQRLNVLRTLLQDSQVIQASDLVANVVLALVRVGGFDGLSEIVDVAERDTVPGLQTQVLEVLIRMRVLQRLIIVPSILAQLNSSQDPVLKQEALAMLNRLGTLVWESGGLPLIIEVLDQGVVDRHLLASVLRTAGTDGEQLLLKLVRFHKDEKVRSSAASVLSYRLPEDELSVSAQIKLADFSYNLYDRARALRPG